MTERIFDDDNYPTSRVYPDHSNASSWLVPLLLLPIAFFGGWVANGYFQDNNFNHMIPGIQTGVGGGPDNNSTIISPLPSNEPTISVFPTPTSAPSLVQ